MRPRNGSDGNPDAAGPTGGRRALSIALGILRLHPRGGLESLCLQVADILRLHGHAVTILTTEAPADLPFKVLRPADRTFFATNHGRMRNFAMAFHEASRTGFDRTVAFQPMPADILLLADGLFDRRDVAFLKRLTPRFRTFAGLEAACLSPGSRTRVIGLAEAQIAMLASRYAIAADRIAVLPPTVNPGSRRPKRLTEAERRQLRADLGLGPGGPVWLWIGLQPSVKGLDRVVDALALAPEAQLLVCGLPDTARKMQPVLRAARRSGVNARIRCLGFVPSEGDRFYDVLRAADVLAHPARTDTTGTVILEAIVNGLPVVATEICGYSEHIRRSGAGMVLGEPFDLRQLSEALAAVSGRHSELSEKGLAYGADPMLYAGVARAVELIEAPLDRPWPVSAGKAGAIPAPRDETAERMNRSPPAEQPSAQRVQTG